MQIPRQNEVEDIVRLARLNLAKDGYLAQMAFFWKGNRVLIVGGRPLETKLDKAVWTTMLRNMAIELNPDTVLTLVECWAAERPANTPANDLRGDVKDKAGSYEGVMFNLETMDGTWFTVAKIVRMEGQGPAFAMPRQWLRATSSGIMTNIIPDKKASAYKRTDS